MLDALSALFSVPVLLTLLAALLDIIANLLLARSNGFRKRGLGLLALLLVGTAFWVLSIAVRELDLAVAYALWGCFGILGTSLSGWALFGQKMHFSAFVGMALLFFGIILLRL
ncbi:MAG: SMR family transporter [Desulfovibrionaceae bacterium]|nr:SMR family transporter [Desulfovibrionaceae bacterium]